MVFSLKKTIIKRIPFIPPPTPLTKQKNEQKNKQKTPYSNEKVEKKNPLHYLFVQAPEKGRKTPRR